MNLLKCQKLSTPNYLRLHHKIKIKPAFKMAIPKIFADVSRLA